MISVIFKSKMPIIKTMTEINIRTFVFGLIISIILICTACHADRSGRKGARFLPESQIRSDIV